MKCFLKFSLLERVRKFLQGSHAINRRTLNMLLYYLRKFFKKSIFAVIKKMLLKAYHVCQKLNILCHVAE